MVCEVEATIDPDSFLQYFRLILLGIGWPLTWLWYLFGHFAELILPTQTELTCNHKRLHRWC